MNHIAFQLSCYCKLSNASFKTDRQQFLRFYCKFHWQLVHYFFGKSINDQCHCCFRINTSLVAIKDLVFTNF